MPFAKRPRLLSRRRKLRLRPAQRRELISAQGRRLSPRDPERPFRVRKAAFRAVTKLLREPPALGVSGCDDPPSGQRDVLELLPDLSAEPHVRDGEPNGGRDAVDEHGISEDRRFVDHHRERSAVPLDLRQPATGVRRR